MLLTYPFFSVDISSVLYEQPHNISVTIPYSHNEWSALLNIERKKKQTKVQKYIRHIFLLY